MVPPDDILLDIVSRQPGCTWRELLLVLRGEGWPGITRKQLNRRLYRIPTLDWEPGIGNERRWFCVAPPKIPAVSLELFVESAETAPSEKLHLYPWQKEALAEWEDRDRQGVIEAVTGAGKTRVAIGAAERELLECRSVVIVVPTIDLLHQWKRELDRLLIDTLEMDATIGLLGDKHRDSLDHCDVLLSTAASGCQEWLLPDNKEGLLIADEVHRYGSESWSRVLEESFDRRLGLTATYERDDSGCEKYLDPYFGGVVFSVDYRRALQDGVIAPFKIAFVAVNFSPHERDAYDEHDRKARRYKKRLVEQYGLPEEPFGEFMREVTLLRTADAGHASLQAGLYLNAFTKRREVLASARSKYTRLNDLTEAVLRADKTIVFAQTREAAEKAVERFTQGGVNGAVLTSHMDRMERKQVLAGFEDGTHELVAAPRLLDEGIDVAAADLAMVLATSRSRRQMVQRMGRVLRLKEDNRLARLAVLYVEDTSEDPNVSHEDFLGLVTPVAHDIEYFSAEDPGRVICRYLNAWRA
jgi:RNA polymerase primary sigma factor